MEPAFFRAWAPRSQGLAKIALAATLWSSSGLFIKLLPQGAATLAFWRSLVAALTITGIRALQGRRPRFHATRLELLGALCYSAVLICFVAATKLTTAANAIFLQFTAPIYLLVLEPLVLGTRLQRQDLWTLLACLGGMALFFREGLGGGALLGNLLGIASGISLALVSLLIKVQRSRDASRDPAQIVWLGNGLVALLCIPWAFPSMGFAPAHTAALAYLGIFQIGIAYLLFTSGLRLVSATAAMITSILEAVLNPIWVFLGTGERPSGSALAGAVVVVAVLACYTLAHTETRTAPPEPVA